MAQVQMRVIVRRIGGDGEYFIAYPGDQEGEHEATAGSSSAEALGYFLQAHAEELGILIVVPSFDYTIGRPCGIQ